MVLVPVEKTFPRGGIQASFGDSSAVKGPRRGKTTKTKLFGNKTVSKESKEKLKKNKDGTKKKKKSSVYRMKQYAGQLSYRTVTEGMLVLGSINKIEEYQLFVSLPGNVTGIVSITNVSDPYTAALRNVLLDQDSNVYQLRDMFKVGQHVVTRVLTKVFENNFNKITLSLAPECIYSDVSHGDVVKGSVVVAAVMSVEEHVYTMDLGVKSTRAFLSKDNARTFESLWNDGKPLGIGQLVRCYVVKSTTVDNCTTLNLTAEPNKVAKATNDSTGATLETLIPGMQFTVTVSRAFPTGIQVRLSDNFVGYVHQDHFSKSFKTPENYEIGSIATAKVLYILQTGAVYFTMKSGILEATPCVSPFEEIKIGTVIEAGEIMSVTEAGLSVRIGKSGNNPLKGFIPIKHTKHIPQTNDDEFDTPLAQQLTTEYPIGSKVSCRVINYNYMEQYFFCTTDELLMTEKYIHSDMLSLGLVVQCYIKSMQLKGIVLSLGKKTSVTGFVPLVHVSDVPLAHPEKKFYVGQPCAARVLSLRDGKVVLTMKPSLVKSNADILAAFGDAVVGAKYVGTVIQVSPKGLLVQFYNLVSGWIPPNLLSNKKIPAEDMSKNFYIGQLINCSIAKKDEENQKLVLSLREIEPTIAVRNHVEFITETAEVVTKLTNGKEPNTKKAKVVAVGAKKVEVVAEVSNGEVLKSKKRKRKKKNKAETEVDSSLTKVEVVTELTNGKEPNTKKAKVVAVEAEKVEVVAEVSDGEVLESKKRKRKKKNNAETEVDSSLTKVEVVANGKELETNKKKNRKQRTESETEGEIKSDEATVVKTKKSGLKDIKSSKKLKSLQQIVVETTDCNNEEIEVESLESDIGVDDAYKIIETLEKKQKKKRKSVVSVETVESEDASCVEGETVDKKRKKRKTEDVEEKVVVMKEAVELPRLSVASGFVWNATPDLLPVVAAAREETDSSDDEEEETNKKKTVKRTRQAIIAEKRLLAQQEEARLRSIEQRLMDADQPPQSADEFDRLVLSSPDSSMVWVQYVAHHLQAAEVEKARQVAQRALKAISFREEQERLNVWVALLNLENLYGTKESLESVLEEAVRVNDAYQVYTKMLQIYGDSHKLQDGDKLVTIMTKKFKALKDTWFNAAMFYMKSGQLEKARGLLQRALASLEKKEHVLVISRFAQMENKMGSMERAQTLFEQILTTYPKRVDVWSAYVDMLVKSNLVHLARQVLERAVVQKLQSHKMKTLFKKFLAFEEAHGNEDSANKVRQMALEYVESAAGAEME